MEWLGGKEGGMGGECNEWEMKVGELEVKGRVGR